MLINALGCVHKFRHLDVEYPCMYICQFFIFFFHYVHIYMYVDFILPDAEVKVQLSLSDTGYMN